MEECKVQGTYPELFKQQWMICSDLLGVDPISTMLEWNGTQRTLPSTLIYTLNPGKLEGILPSFAYKYVKENPYIYRYLWDCSPRITTLTRL